MALKDKFVVRLNDEQRQELEKLAATGERSAAAVTRARIGTFSGRNPWRGQLLTELLRRQSEQLPPICRRQLHT